jgi:aminoglycoside phosphotransferase (APT) family kinase protein
MDDLRARLTTALEAQGAAAVASVTPLGGGACQELFRVELEDQSLWVLRSDAKRSLPGSLDRAREFAVLERAAAAGVRTPAPRWLCRDLLREGASAYFMPWTAGEALGGRVVRGKALAGARAGLCADLAAQLATLHRVLPEQEPALVEALGPPPEDPARAALATLSRMAGALETQRPAIQLALAWLEANLPEPLAPCLTHGDFRVGNFLVSEEGLQGVLDWEFAHWGDPAEDLAWLCVRDWRFGREDLAAGGLGTREELSEAYQAAGGADFEPGRLRFWEVFGNARWAVGARYQAERYLSGAQRDLELLAIGWRALELEYETLRQIGDYPLELPAPLAAPRVAERPDAATVLNGLADWLGELKQEDRGAAFRLKIAESLLRSLALEVPLRTRLDGRERTRLEGVLGTSAMSTDDTDLRAHWEQELCQRVCGASEEDQVRLRACVSAGLAATLQVRNPRFDLSPELP